MADVESDEDKMDMRTKDAPSFSPMKANQIVVVPAWNNGPRIDRDHFHFVEDDFERRKEFVSALRERLRIKVFHMRV
jgi:hypothetical protein